MGIFLIAQIPWVERGVGHDRLVIWHRKLGPDGALCDALATALMVDGMDAEKWIGRPELNEYRFWTIDRHDGTAWSYGYVF